MKINLQIIVCKMNQRNTELFITTEGRTLLSARLLTNKLSQFDSCAVYIGRTSDILALQASGLPENLICVGKGDIKSLLETNQYNVLVVDSYSPLEIHNEIQNIFDFYNQIDSELTNEILYEKDLQAVLDICTRFFDNPVYILDSAYKLIACSSNMNDPEWQNIKDTGHLGVDKINLLKKFDLLDKSDGSPQLVSVESIPPFLAAGIYDNGEKIGAVGVRQLYSDISQPQLCLLQYVSEMLTIAVSKENYSRYVRATYTNRFMIDMLKGTVFEVNFIIHNLSQIGWKIDDDYYIFKILPDPKDIAGGTVKFSGELIKNMYPGSVLLLLDDILVLIVNTRSSQLEQVDAFVKLDEFLKKRNFTCGVSMAFRDFSNLFDQYTLASAAIELGRLMDKTKKLYHYGDYIMPHMISICDQTFNVRMLCHFEAVKLHEFDKINNNNYFYCLYIYLLNEKSLLQSAKQLNIHRSTLIYRLNKIAELIKVDLSDHRVRTHLLFSYQILHFLDCLRG